ncbi:MAG: peptidase [Candidatus Cyclobacteriaceae bacterium M2_1C_046]
MKHSGSLLLAFSALVISLNSCNTEIENAIPQPPESISLSESVFYSINLNDRSGDSFKVRVFVDNLTETNSIFQFPATAPGTYDNLNFGNYVEGFSPFDENYNLLEFEKISTNQWKLLNPGETAIIEYSIRETWDEKEPIDFIYKMAGTSIEDDHSLINTFAVLGYPTGLKEMNYVVDIEHPANWIIGTALPIDDNGFYTATDYDHLADSPILLGQLTAASTTVDQTVVDIWTYSTTGINTSADIKFQVDEVINDAKVFLKVLPVDNYSFLYHFEVSAGALEHSYSSVHVLKELPVDQYSSTIKHIAAHEFFHIVTPLNIHSEIIEDFNFVDPTPSRHLWLYEGVTEWAAWMMRYRNNSIDINRLLQVFQSKIISNENYYDKSYSLTDISLQSYTAEGGSQFGNVYNRGAIVAALLDIRLLELSNGEKGLREVVLDLVNMYGPANAFRDDQFFDAFVAMTYPEIEDFITNYIQGTTDLPYQEYFLKIGIEHNPENHSSSLLSNPTAQQQHLFERWSMNF